MCLFPELLVCVWLVTIRIHLQILTQPICFLLYVWEARETVEMETLKICSAYCFYPIFIWLSENRRLITQTWKFIMQQHYFFILCSQSNSGKKTKQCKWKNTKRTGQSLFFHPTYKCRCNSDRGGKGWEESIKIIPLLKKHLKTCTIYSGSKTRNVFMTKFQRKRVC